MKQRGGVKQSPPPHFYCMARGRSRPRPTSRVVFLTSAAAAACTWMECHPIGTLAIVVWFMHVQMYMLFTWFHFSHWKCALLPKNCSISLSRGSAPHPAWATAPARPRP